GAASPGNSWATLPTGSPAPGEGVTTNIVGGGTQFFARDDLVNVGNNGRVQDIRGLLNIENPKNYNQVTLNDWADTSSRIVRLSTLPVVGGIGNPNAFSRDPDPWGQVSSLAPASIRWEYPDSRNLTINGGTGTNTL